MLATIGENRRLLVFSLDEVNEMTRGKGIILQRFKDGGLSDARGFVKSAGLTWIDAAGRNFTLSAGDMAEWIAQRAQAGRMAPKGFPRSNRFGPPFGA
jgi:topoisomerase-4 subunit A